MQEHTRTGSPVPSRSVPALPRSLLGVRHNTEAWAGEVWEAV